MMIPEIVLVGPVEDMSGAGEATRNIYDAVMGLGLKIKIIPTEEPGRAKINIPNEMQDRYAFGVNRDDVRPMTALHILGANSPVLSIREAGVQVSLSMTGGIKCPDNTQMKLASNGFKENWVPAKSMEAGWKSGGSAIANTIRYVPIGVDVERFNPNVKKLNIKQLQDAKNPVVFLLSEEWTKIKSQEMVVSTFLKEFKDCSDAYLVIKFTSDPAGQIKTAIKQRIMNERMLTGSNANVLLLPDYMEYELVPSLFKTASFFVSTSKLEAWPTSALQAMACGVPVIAPNSGGYAEVIDGTNGYPVKSTETQINDRNFTSQNPSYTGHSWYELSPQSLAVRMKQAYDEYKNGDGSYEAKAKASRETALKHNFNNLAGRMVVQLGKFFN